MFQSCQLAAGLFVVGTVLDMLTHCSLSAAIGKLLLVRTGSNFLFSFLTNYDTIIMKLKNYSNTVLLQKIRHENNNIA